MRIPGLVHAEDIINLAARVNINGKWVQARPVPYYGMFRRFKLAWLVFTGECDAIKWEGQ